MADSTAGEDARLVTDGDRGALDVISSTKPVSLRAMRAFSKPNPEGSRACVPTHAKSPRSSFRSCQPIPLRD